ncbi:MAG: hypothetical protein EP335_05840 [Alphaproteobacteria bacterium]|nr:MAG: hypothetical protein EP335_05840 [Alphaproteobacteria bacterium]
MKKALIALLAACTLGACAQQQTIKPYDYTAYRQVDPRSILVVPVVNSSNEAEAPDFFLTTLPTILGEKGYYVFPVNMVKRSMEADGLGDAALVHSADPRKLGEIFHTDMVLYVEILNWDSNYSVFASGTTVAFNYALKSALTGETMWENQSEVYVSQSSNSGNIIADLIANAIVGAINSMKSDYTPVAKMANAIALGTAGRGIPNGPYSKTYKSEADMKAFPSTGSGWHGGPDPEAEAPAPTEPAEATEPAEGAGQQ